MKTPLAFHWLLAGCSLLVGSLHAEHDWWSLKPLVKPLVPKTDALNPIDHFIIARQTELGLAMSLEADRRTLIRRLYFDLIGLPPSLEDVTGFVKDERPEAYGELVDRLLASPRYGERWARHWLDVVHYGDTHGYDKDKLRPNAWPYRDYVIRAFNEDRPYGEFVKEQLAGDVLWPDTVDGIVATGFIAAGPWDFIGHAEVAEEKIDGKVARHLDRDDMVATTMNTFCSITVQCAQCHEHKRDPVSMEDYYSLQAVFAALDRADRPYDSDPETTRQRALLTEMKSNLDHRVKALTDHIEKNRPKQVVALDERIAQIKDSMTQFGDVPEKPRSPRYGYHSQVAKEQSVTKWVQIDLGKETPLDCIVLRGADEYGFTDFGFPHRFRIEMASTANFSDARMLADHTAEDFPRPGALPLSFEGKNQSARYVRVTATKLWSRRKAGEALSGDWIFAIGEMLAISGGKMLPVNGVTALDSIEAGERWGKANLVDGVFGKYLLSDYGGEETIIAWNTKGPMKLFDELEALQRESNEAIQNEFPDELSERKSVEESLREVGMKLTVLPKPQMVYAGTVHNGSGTFKGRGSEGGKPRTITVLARGEVTKPGKEVGAGTVDFISNAPSRFPLPPNHVEGDRRVALAEWITHKDNPLTWRTIVNRIWLYHFGQGIVDSPNDFGKMGQLPTHPELLDWLAVEFRDGGQSIKNLHRLILNSAVYKQSTTHNAEAAKIDGGNQYLWRMNRRKLEAETLRDMMLLVSGKLDLKMYGPGFQDFVIEKPEHSPHYMYDKHDPDDAKTHRRSVYRFLVRSQPQPFMDTLDCADPSLLVDKRNETLTALQALALLNNKFVVRMAEHFSERLEGECSGREEQIVLAFQLTLNRAPTVEELKELVEYAEVHGLPAACRIIFNLNEFAFAD
jgi:hypothetical protein